MNIKRVLSRVVVYGLIGLIVNVLVAWGFAAWGTVGAGRIEPTSELDSLRLHLRDIARKRFRAFELREEYWYAVRADGIGLSAARDQGQMVAEIAVVDCGWPLRSLRWYAVYVRGTSSGPVQLNTRNWLELPQRWPSLMGAGPVQVAVSRRLPLLPLAAGTIVDTALYGVLAWFAANGVASLRRSLRRRRGLCPSCAYDIRGDHAGGCPECGWGRATAKP